MRILLTGIWMLAIIFKAPAQISREDSLIAETNMNGKPIRQMNACRELSKLYASRDFNQSLHYAVLGSQLSFASGDTASAGEFYRLAGSAWYFKGQYDSAASCLYRSLHLLDKEKDQQYRALTLNDLGKLYRKTRDLDRALQHYREALDIYQKLNDEDGKATILNESGVVYEYKGDYEEALSRYRQSLAIREKLNDPLGKSYSLSFIGGVYTLLKDINPARQNLEASLAIRRKLNDPFCIAQSYVDLGYMYREMKSYDMAIRYYDSANQIALGMKYPQLLLENYHSMASIEEERNDPQRALSYIKQYNLLKDSIMSGDKIKQIEELNARYQAEKKEQQLKLQQAAIEKKNILIWGIAILSLLLIYAGVSTVRKNRAQARFQLQQAVSREQENAARAVIDAEDKERQRIAAELHDGIGQMMSAAKMNLSVFESELDFNNEQQKKSFENVISLVDMSCREIRSVSHQMMPNALVKKGLAEAVREFIDRIDHRVIQVSFYAEGLEDSLDPNTSSVLYRVIQECVNNTLKHAKAGLLDISLIRDQDGLSVTIEDDGQGFDSRQVSGQEGIGLKNIYSRIQYLKGTVEYNSTPGKGTLVAIHIPPASLSGNP